MSRGGVRGPAAGAGQRRGEQPVWRNGGSSLASGEQEQQPPPVRVLPAVESLSAREFDVPSLLAFKKLLCAKVLHLIALIPFRCKQRHVRAQGFRAEGTSGLCKQKKHPGKYTEEL